MKCSYLLGFLWAGARVSQRKEGRKGGKVEIKEEQRSNEEEKTCVERAGAGLE